MGSPPFGSFLIPAAKIGSELTGFVRDDIGPGELTIYGVDVRLMPQISDGQIRGLLQQQRVVCMLIE